MDCSIGLQPPQLAESNLSGLSPSSNCFCLTFNNIFGLRELSYSSLSAVISLTSKSVESLYASSNRVRLSISERRFPIVF